MPGPGVGVGAGVGVGVGVGVGAGVGVGVGTGVGVGVGTGVGVGVGVEAGTVYVQLSSSPAYCPAASQVNPDRSVVAEWVRPPATLCPVESHNSSVPVIVLMPVLGDV